MNDHSTRRTIGRQIKRTEKTGAHGEVVEVTETRALLVNTDCPNGCGRPVIGLHVCTTDQPFDGAGGGA